jgi:hypothetical protein
MLLDTGMNIESALFYTNDYVNNPRAIKILFTIAKKYSDYVQQDQTDESNFTPDMIGRLLQTSEEEFNAILLNVDNLIEQTGASQYEALEIMVFYNQQETEQFITNIENGFPSNLAFKLIVDEIQPNDEDLEKYNRFKTMFSEDNSFLLLFTSYHINIPYGYVYSDDEIQQMIELQTVHGEKFIYHLPF